MPGKSCAIQVRIAGRVLLLAAAVGSLLVSCAPQQSRTPNDLLREVVVTGRGATEREARREAVAAGMRQLAGEYIEAEVEIEDDEIARNRIRGFSNAPGISSRQIGSARAMPNGDLEVTMIVKFDPDQQRRRRGAGRNDSVAAVQVQGAEILAELDAEQSDRALRSEILGDRAPLGAAGSMFAVMIDRGGRPRAGIGRDEVVRVGPSRFKVPLLVEIGFDLDRWQREMRPRFHDLLLAACVRYSPRGAVFASERSEGTVVPIGAPIWTADPALWSGVVGSDGDAAGRPVVTAAWPAPGHDLIALLVDLDASGSRVTFDCYEVASDVLASLRAEEVQRRVVASQLREAISTTLGLEIVLLDRSGAAIGRRHVAIARDGGQIETLASIRGGAVSGQIATHAGVPWFFDAVRFRAVDGSQVVNFAMLGPWFVGLGSLETTRPRLPAGGWTGPANWPVAWVDPRSWFTTSVHSIELTLNEDELDRLAGIDVRVLSD